MPDTSSLEAPAGTTALVSETPSTAGQLLRAARQKAGVHLAVLSVTLKVPVKELEALENDQLDPAKGAVFARALASSVCRQLRIDSAPVLALLPQNSTHLAPQRVPSPLTSSARPMGSRSLSAPRLRSRHALLAGLMLALTAALIWLPAPSQWTWLDRLGLSSQTAQPVAPASSEPAFMAPGTVLEPVTSASDQAVSQAAPLMVSSVPVAAASSAAVPAPAAPAVVAPVVAPPVAAAMAPKAPVTASAAAPGDLVFAASEASWIEVRDAQKQVVFSGVLQPGEKKPVQGALPLTVVVGRAQGVSVTWRGQPFDLKPHTQVTVARFELKP